jgi:hypothetical protein
MNTPRILVLFLVICISPAFAQSYKMHSVFIYSFTRYVQWPDAYNQGDFEIQVLGDSPVLDELITLSKTKKIGERSIKVTHLKSPSEIRKCNMLFVSASSSPQLPDVVSKINSQATLIVTEESGLGQKGSHINFITKDGKLAFELNQTAVSKQGLKVSNELSRLAILI